MWVPILLGKPLCFLHLIPSIHWSTPNAGSLEIGWTPAMNSSWSPIPVGPRQPGKTGKAVDSPFIWGDLYHSKCVSSSWVIQNDIQNLFEPSITSLYHGYTMVIPWLYHGYTMVIPWLYHGYTMVIPWLYYGYTMVILWLYYGYTMIIPWLYHGYTMVIPWLYHDYGLFSAFHHDFTWCLGGFGCFLSPQVPTAPLWKRRFWALLCGTGNHAPRPKSSHPRPKWWLMMVNNG